MSKKQPGGPGLLFGPGPEGSWDSERVSCPRVLRCADGVWRMWYYGRDETFDREINLPTGRSGLATSQDGISWTRQKGPGVMGSIMDPNPDPNRFDSAHLGVNDVVERDGVYWMWYFGGSQAKQKVGQWEVRGFDLRPGLAISRDGLNFHRVEGPVKGAFMDGGETDNPMAFCGWPQVIEAAPGDWRMYYHTLDIQRGFEVRMAVSGDGFSWEKRGAVLGKSEDADAFDSNGCATRHVVRHGGQWLMFYEGVRPDGVRSMGLASSPDGFAWTKQKGAEANGSVLMHAPSEDFWDGYAVGCPCIVEMPDGGMRMYYIGSTHFGPEGATGEMALLHQIGLAVSDGDPARWRRYEG